MVKFQISSGFYFMLLSSNFIVCLRFSQLQRQSNLQLVITFSSTVKWHLLRSDCYSKVRPYKRYFGEVLEVFDIDTC